MKIRVKEERNNLLTIKRRKANWIFYSLHRNCLLNHVIEGKIEGMGRRRKRRRKQLLDDLKEKRRCWNLKEEVLNRSCFKRGYGAVIRRVLNE